MEKAERFNNVVGIMDEDQEGRSLIVSRLQAWDLLIIVVQNNLVG